MNEDRIIPQTASRRRMLKGYGALLALPWLESAIPRAVRAQDKVTESATGLPAGRPPVRSAFIYFPNGVWEKSWTPDKSGRDYELRPTLQPLSEVKDDVLVLTGLNKKKIVMAVTDTMPRRPIF